MTDGMWNLSELYSGTDDPKIELDLQNHEDQAAEFSKKWSGRTDYLSDPTVLRKALDEYEILNRTIWAGGLPGYYASLMGAIDGSNAKVKALDALITKRDVAISDNLRFFWLSIGKIDADTQKAMLESTELKPYHTVLALRFESAMHDLDESVQSALSRILPQATSSWTSMVKEALSGASSKIEIDGTVRDVSFGELTSYITTTDANLARRANEAHVEILSRVVDIAEHEINAVITTSSHMSQLKGYERPDAGSFIRYDLPASTVDSMLQAVEDRYSIAHDYYRLRARLMGLDSIEYHQRALAYGSLPNGYTFDEAAAMLRDVLKELNPKFATEFDEALASGHIDHVPRKGKRGGAACWRGSIDEPIYMMLNFTGQLSDVETLAHEFGHYLNNRYMQTGGHCDSLSYGTTTPLAETASTFFEKYILDAAGAGVSDETKLAIQLATISRSIATVFRQAAATRFEQELYVGVMDKGHLSKDEIGEMFVRHMAAYTGPAMTHDDGTDLSWIHWMHFRRGFYNYGYTFAHLVSSTIQDRVDADPEYIGEFCRLLEAGRSQRTADLLRSLNLNVNDGSVWNTGLDKLEHQVQDATALATKLGKI